MNYAMYWAGWLLFVLGQAQNSIASSSNSLQGWAGWRRWLSLHWYTLLLRAFLSLIGEGAIQHFVFSRLEPLLTAYGLEIAVWGMAGLSGLSANVLLYQGIGLLGQKFPGLRVEVPLLAPPDKSQSPSQSPPTTGVLQ